MRVGGNELDIVTAHEMYERDRLAMEAGIDGRLLMENAGRAVAYDFLKRIEPQQKVVVLIGGGNNGETVSSLPGR